MPSSPHDPPATHDPSSSSDSMIALQGSRRRRLLLGGASLLALGVVLNASRFVAVEPEEDHAAMARYGLETKAETKAEARFAASSRHRGEEGTMGRPTAKSGLYAMKGPRSAVPTSPPAPAPMSDDPWAGLTGAEVGATNGVGGLGLVGTGRGGGGTGEATIGIGSVGLVGKGGGGQGGRVPQLRHGKPTSTWAESVESARRHGPRAEPPARRGLERAGTHALPPGPLPDTGFIAVADDPRSTFSIDVDTASYSAARRSVVFGSLPAPESVRVEEMVNYFDYEYAAPTGDVPFSVTAEVGECPWNPEHELVHVGLQGKVIAPEDLPPRNLVFLVDVSGSMDQPDKLPLVKHSLSRLVSTLRAEDRISLVVYAGAAGVVLPPTAGSERATIEEALRRLGAGGGTNGAEGIVAAYAQARAAFMEDGVNRVILASDGDFNVGVSSHDELVEMIETQRKSGIELSVLGYGMGHRDHTMEQLADEGNGNYAYIDGPDEAEKVLVEEAGGTLVTIAKDVKIQVQLDPTRVLSYRLVGYDNRRLAHQDFADDTKDAGEIGAGHSVTALYEVVPRSDAPADAPWMTVSLRYKPPKGDESSLLQLPVVAEPRALASTSDDFRFSAAVASYAMLLRDPLRTGELGASQATWGSTQALAREALGDDPSCRRHHFVDLVGRAGALAGDREVTREPECSTEPVIELEPELDHGRYHDPYYDDPPMIESSEGDEPTDWSELGAWALEVLRLLPPLLALPLFVMALRRPRRRE